MEIRRARAADVEVIRRLVRQAYAVYVPRIGREPAPMWADYGSLVLAGAAWVVIDDSEVAGVLVVQSLADSLLLENVAVRPESQGRGIGRALIAFAESEAARRGYDTVTLYTNARMSENLALYLRLGYVETGRGGQDGFERVFFSKAIEPRADQ